MPPLAAADSFAFLVAISQSFRCPMEYVLVIKRWERLSNLKWMLGIFSFLWMGAQTHGTHPWQNEHQRRSVLFKYVSRTASRGGARPYYEPETYWNKEIVIEMTPEQRAVMFGPTSTPRTEDTYLTVDEDGIVCLGQ